MSTQADHLATDVRNAYEWRDREMLERALKRMISLFNTMQNTTKTADLSQKTDQNDRK